MSVLVLGATGSIGRATTRALTMAGYAVVCPVRRPQNEDRGAVVTYEDVATMNETTLADLMRKHDVRSIISCVASRNGTPRDAWAVDFGVNEAAKIAAGSCGVDRFVLLSAICVQRPRLAFQHAKLAFEASLKNSALSWTSVRSTAYFKSLSGQVDRVRRGRPFLVFGNGRLTSCKPISDRDLGRFLVECLEDSSTEGKTLPIGGPGAALTPLDQGHLLFDALGLEPRFRHVPPGLLRHVARGLKAGSLAWRPLAEKAELARIGHYYATESMLVWDADAQQYDADATPSYGTETLKDHYQKLVSNDVQNERGAHAVF